MSVLIAPAESDAVSAVSERGRLPEVAHAHHCLLLMHMSMPISPKAVVKVDNSFLLSVASL